MCERKSGHYIMFNLNFRLLAMLILQPGEQFIFSSLTAKRCDPAVIVIKKKKHHKSLRDGGLNKYKH